MDTCTSLRPGRKYDFEGWYEFLLDLEQETKDWTYMRRLVLLRRSVSHEVAIYLGHRLYIPAMYSWAQSFHDEESAWRFLIPILTSKLRDRDETIICEPYSIDELVVRFQRKFITPMEFWKLLNIQASRSVIGAKETLRVFWEAHSSLQQNALKQKEPAFTDYDGTNGDCNLYRIPALYREVECARIHGDLDRHFAFEFNMTREKNKFQQRSK